MKAADAVGLVFFGNLPVNWRKIIMAFSKRFYHLFLSMSVRNVILYHSFSTKKLYINFCNYVSEQFAIEST